MTAGQARSSLQTAVAGLALAGGFAGFALASLIAPPVPVPVTEPGPRAKIAAPTTAQRRDAGSGTATISPN